MQRILSLVLFLLSISFLFTPLVSAETSISIENNTSGSESHVQVTSTSTSINDTYVRIEQNGEVKEYRSDKPENISVQSTDGNATVLIQKNDQITIVPTLLPTESAPLQEKMNQIVEEKKATRATEKEKREKEAVKNNQEIEREVKKEKEAMFQFLQEKVTVLKDIITLQFLFDK